MKTVSELVLYNYPREYAQSMYSNIKGEYIIILGKVINKWFIINNEQK